MKKTDILLTNNVRAVYRRC